ncbi:hypothetical protein E2C01_050570 [Portunus trituberculatus]|uniref:Uncharacterized protein n=1 Tax=Portunus trituberculatus TaxID=210409 RepID=A0A5B7GGB9_PORTR|nr:hypothetical protein [Portunus trituberculatus]
MATPSPASESPSGEETRNVPRSNSSLDDNPKYFDTSLNFFYINFCNIHGLRSNFQYVEHHLSSTKPHLLFHTKVHLTYLRLDPQKQRFLWRFASASSGT